MRSRRTSWIVVAIWLLAPLEAPSAAERWSLFDYLGGSPPATLVGYTPSQLDPRNPANHARLATSSLEADLAALRPAFDGLILYGYNESSTPRTLAVARQLGYRAVLLAIWDIKSTAELDGVAALAEQFGDQLAIGIIVGNEGLTFGRYESADLAIAEQRLRFRLGDKFPLTTTEPLVGYEREVVLKFGDFLAPNIHPVFDRSQLAAPEAADWARGEALRLAKLARKPVLLKETGFPHAETANYSLESQQAFWKSFTAPGLIAASGDQPVYFNAAFEAFDLPWKSEASNLEIEKSWGLLSSTRQTYPAFEVWRKLATSGVK